MTISYAAAGNRNNSRPVKLAVLGSTGSIGCQTLDIVRAYPGKFSVAVLSSNTRWEKLARQAAEFLPRYAVIADKTYEGKLKSSLSGLPVRVLSGSEALAKITGECDADTVVNALVGFSGLMPSVVAIKSGKKLALANKESLVVAGQYIMPLAKEKGVAILPIDSEHSAILQCLAGEISPVKKIILTASGGALREVPPKELPAVTVEQALNHPNWNMGAKITIDSATMVNKAFEIIEAQWLFSLNPRQIEVVIHPQSVIHSMVEFADGAVKAQLGTPDMYVPIQYALTYPERWEITAEEAFSISRYRNLDFFEPDFKRFPALSTAYEVMGTGGNRGCVFNAANEAAVAAFLTKKIRFTDIQRIIDHCLDTLPYGELPPMDTIIECHETVYRKAHEYIDALAL